MLTLILQPAHNAEPALTEREALETELIRRLISSYFNIVRETTADQVPKAIMHLLVNHSRDEVQNRLVSELYKEDLFGELLYEDDGIKKEREKCEKLLATYKEAAKIVAKYCKRSLVSEKKFSATGCTRYVPCRVLADPHLYLSAQRNVSSRNRCHRT